MFRFTIRELVLLTAVVAMGLAWWLDRSHISAAHTKSAAAQARAEADYAETLKALVELHDAVGKRGLSTAQDYGQRIEVVGPIQSAP